MIESAFEEKAPHKICAYIYEVSNAFNSFYHETKILKRGEPGTEGILYPPAFADQESA